MKEREKSPILRDRSPLRLWKTYEKGLLPTPNIRPLRHVIWVPHPVLELENALKLAKGHREFSLLQESEPCEYEHGIFLKYQVGIYGEKIARISVDSDEALKAGLENDFSPRTKEIYGMLECQLLHSLQDACRSEQGRTRGNAHQVRNASAEQSNPGRERKTSSTRGIHVSTGVRGTDSAFQAARAKNAKRHAPD